MKILNITIVAVAMMAMTTPSVAGDAAAGEATFNSKGCTGCHGTAGAAPTPGNPSLAGKDEAFIKKSLAEFKSGTRKNPTMNAMAGMLSDADVDNVAAYIGNQK